MDGNRFSHQFCHSQQPAWGNEHDDVASHDETRLWQAQSDRELTTDDPLRNYQLFALEPSASPQGLVENVTIQPFTSNPKKRDYYDAFQIRQTSWYGSAGSLTQHGSSASDHIVRNVFPELFPSVPRPEDRNTIFGLINPFLEEPGFLRHPTLPMTRASASKDNVGHGYIKIRIREISEADQTPTRTHSSREQANLPNERSFRPRLTDLRIPGLPPDFGRGVKLDMTDQKVFRFFLKCYCSGRTLLPQNNLWLLDIAPMIAGSDCVKHSILSFSSGYILDFVPKKAFQDRANLHYRQAVRLIGQGLRNKTSQDVGKEEALIASLMMLLGDDIVNWELRRPVGQEARWYSAARLARTILDNSDPGHRYWKAENVQASRARLSMSNWVAFVNILADAVTPLSMHICMPGGKLYPWLLGGTTENIRKIHGGTGLCPKLLHIFAQISHLTTRLALRPDSQVIILAAEKIEERLRNFYQWSDLSYGHESVDSCFEHCVSRLDRSTGKVTSPAQVVDLTGQAWIATTQIYLHCRFFRRPRHHSIVRKYWSILNRCIELMPSKGQFFTAQAPFFPIVIMALVSASATDRKVAREWFETVVSWVGDRSSVPPVWAAVQRIWVFMDTKMIEDKVTEELAVCDRSAWWESMVEYIIQHEGYLSLV